MSFIQASIDENKTLVRRFYDCINRDRADLFPSVVAASYIDHSNGGRGPEGVAAAAANLHRAYEGLHIGIADIVCEANLVAVRWVETGRHVGQFFNLRPTGKRFEARGLTLFLIQNGRIVESWLAIDPSTLRAQQEAQRRLETTEGR